MKNSMKFLLPLLLIVTFNTILAQQTGTINGTIIDKQNGDKLISATVMLKDVSGNVVTGTRTKFDGSYLLKEVKPGTYNLNVNYLGYQQQTIANIELKPGEQLKFDIQLLPEDVMTEEVVVEARAIKETGAALLKDRQKAAAAQDAIGSEEMTKKGAGDAGEALKKVTGVTIVDGKNLVVRGLSNRYAKTQLNGASLPSADPDSRSVDLDLFSSNMIENIVTIKTATPDKPGDFTGGAVDIKTKSYPDQFFYKIGVSSNYNFQVTGEDILQSPASNTDWLGVDDGQRELTNNVENLINKYGEFPDVNTIFRREGTSTFENGEFQNADVLDEVNALAREINQVSMAPRPTTAQPNTGFSMSVGNQYKIDETPIGFTANLNYNRNYSFYQDGIFALWENNDVEADSLNNVNYFRDSKGVENVMLGGMLGLSTTLFKFNELSFNFMYNQAGTNTGRYLSGRWPGSSGIPTRGFSSWSNRYVERDLTSYQLKGQHQINALLGMKIDWQVTSSDNGRHEPNFSLFGYDWVPSDESTVFQSNPNPTNPQYGITASAYDEPARIFRDMNESNLNYAANLELPLDDVFDMPFKFKTGYFSEQIDRSFEESWFIYKWGNKSFPNEQLNDPNFQSYDPINDPNAVFTNLVGTTEDGNFVDPNMYLQYQQPFVNSYTGETEINAFYGMIDFKPIRKLRVIAGARMEQSRLVAVPFDSPDPNFNRNRLELFKSEYESQGGDTTGIGFEDFGVDENDILPSVNIVYEVVDNFNLRTAYYRTLARPNLREIAPYNSFDFIGGFQMLGNPFLERTLIDNYDLRAEYFPNPGELVAISGYYKQFDNPIERSIVSLNGDIRYQNADRGFVLGTEIELRKNLMNLVNEISGSRLDYLKYFDMAFNLSLTHAEVEIPENSRDADIIKQAEIQKLTGQYLDDGLGQEEAELLAEQNANPDLTRDFVGQSPYVINFDLSYSNPELGLNISSNFNVFGRRLDFIQLGIDPNVYELPRPDLNLIISKKFYQDFNVRLTANNILNPYTAFAQQFNGNDFYNRRYRLGTSVSLSLSYTFN